MDNLISRLSELRSQYSCFDENERGAYHTLSEAIKVLQEQKTGKWIDGNHRQTCSICRYRGMRSWRFCPSCGALMRSEEE